MRLRSAALLLAAVLSLVSGSVAFASSGAAPPPPPPPPDCKSCPGPPPPPTPVPTPAPTIVAPQPVVDVKLDTPKVPRGHAVKVGINASTDDAVTLIVHYRHAKPARYHATIGSSGRLTKSWKVPKSVAPGKVVIVVTVRGDGARVSKELSLLITA